MLDLFPCSQLLQGQWKTCGLLLCFWAYCGVYCPGGYKEGPYQDRPPLCPFRLLPLLIYSGSTIAFLKILKVQGPKSKNIENKILLQP